MAVNVGMQVEGGRELRRTLRQAGDDLTDLKAAHAAVAGIVTPRAALMAPRGRTGRLAGSVRPGATKTASLIRAGRKSIPYAGVQHFGWPARHISAQPFAATAAHDTEPRWTLIFEAAVNRIISRIKGV